MKISLPVHHSTWKCTRKIQLIHTSRNKLRKISGFARIFRQENHDRLFSIDHVPIQKYNDWIEYRRPFFIQALRLLWMIQKSHLISPIVWFKLYGFIRIYIVTTVDCYIIYNQWNLFVIFESHFQQHSMLNFHNNWKKKFMKNWLHEILMDCMFS